MYNQMLDLTTRNEAFYFVDYEKYGNTYRVFNYRLASWTDFQEPFAKEMRGITFLMLPGKDPIIVSRPFAKFFNLNENPDVMNLDLSKATCYEEKADGSLIATFYDDVTGEFGLKSKQAFFSEQAVMAEQVLQQNIALHRNVEFLAANNYTVLMELCSPANRIVLEYETTHLKVHGVRHNITGLYLEKNDLPDFPALQAAWVDQVVCQGLPEDFVASTVASKGIEGYVVQGPWGRFKLKSEWYCNLHHLKDSISTTKSLIESIIYERVDDVKALFKTDAFTLNRIKEMEEKVIPIFNHIVKTTETFVVVNKDLTRKDFAVKGQADIPQYFHLAMNKYLGKEPDYKDFCMKFYRELFAVKDEDVSLV